LQVEQQLLVWRPDSPPASGRYPDVALQGDEAIALPRQQTGLVLFVFRGSAGDLGIWSSPRSNELWALPFVRAVAELLFSQ
jgi:hypothetical protein